MVPGKKYSLLFIPSFKSRTSEPIESTIPSKGAKSLAEALLVLSIIYPPKPTLKSYGSGNASVSY